VKKSVILSTSPYSRRIKTPAGISLEMINMPSNRTLFNEEFVPTGVLLEGVFQSVFKNRMIAGLKSVGKKTIDESKPTKMIVIADGSIIANGVDYSTEKPSIKQLGHDRVSGFVFGNKEFIVNAINYLNDSHGIMQLRNRTIKLRLLDKVKLRDEKVFWQWLNILLPVVIISIFGAVYNLIRRRRFGR
jgi:ABC-2 type transport system permease protein